LGEPMLLEDLESAGHPQSPQALHFLEMHTDAEDRLRSLLRAATAPVPDLDDKDMAAVLQERRRVADDDVTRLRARRTSRTVPLRMLFDDPNVDPSSTGALLVRLKTLGVNPAGNDVLYQDYSYDGSWHRWTDFFEWSPREVGWRRDLS